MVKYGGEKLARAKFTLIGAWRGTGLDQRNSKFLNFGEYNQLITPFGVSHAKIVMIFTARRNADIASAVLATAIPSVCPSVRLSHAGIVSKRRHVARCSLHCRIAKCV